MSDRRQLEIDFTAAEKRGLLRRLSLPRVVNLGGVRNTVSSRSMKMVLTELAGLCLATRSNVCWPSIATLRERTGLSEDTVARALKALAKEGLIVVEQRHLRGRQASNEYLVLWSEIAAHGETEPDPRSAVPRPAQRDDQTRAARPPDPRSAPPVPLNRFRTEELTVRSDGAGGGEFLFLGEIERADVATVEGIDRLFAKIVRRGGFGFRDRLRDRFAFHAIWASVVRSWRAGEVKTPIGCFLARIRRGREHWRPLIQRSDRRTVRRLWSEGASLK